MRAFAHPVRVQLLEVLVAHHEGATLPEMAETFEGCDLARLSYHLAVLADCGAVSQRGHASSRGRLTGIYELAPPHEWMRDTLLKLESRKSSEELGS